MGPDEVERARAGRVGGHECATDQARRAGGRVGDARAVRARGGVRSRRGARSPPTSGTGRTWCSTCSRARSRSSPIASVGRLRPGQTRSSTAACRAGCRAIARSRVLVLLAPAGLEELLSIAADPATDPGRPRRAARGRRRPGRARRMTADPDRARRRSRARPQRDEGAAGRAARPRGDRRGRRRRRGRRARAAEPSRRGADGPRDAGARRHRGDQADPRRGLAAPASSSSPPTTTTASCCARCGRARPASSSRTPPPTGSPRRSAPWPRATRCSRRRSPGGSSSPSSARPAPASRCGRASTR